MAWSIVQQVDLGRWIIPAFFVERKMAWHGWDGADSHSKRLLLCFTWEMSSMAIAGRRIRSCHRHSFALARTYDYRNPQNDCSAFRNRSHRSDIMMNKQFGD
jgi:hypothetical protein